MIIAYNSKRDVNRINHFTKQFPDAQHRYINNSLMQLSKLIAAAIRNRLIGQRQIIFVGGPLVAAVFLPLFKLLGLQVTYDTYDFPKHKEKLTRTETLYLKLYAWLVGFSDEIIFLNECYCASFLQLSGAKFQQRITILPPIPRLQDLSRQSISTDLAMVYVGHFAHVHEVETFVEWYAALSERIGIPLEIIGKDRIGRMEALKARFASQNIRFWGRLERLDDHIRLGNIGIGIFGKSLKSLDSETNKILEYMNAGMIVMTGYNKALPRFFPEAAGIFYVTNTEEVSQTLEYILTLDTDRREALGRSNHEALAKMSNSYPKTMRTGNA